MTKEFIQQQGFLDTLDELLDNYKVRLLVDNDTITFLYEEGLSPNFPGYHVKRMVFFDTTIVKQFVQMRSKKFA